jgi:hypothetical protein
MDAASVVDVIPDPAVDALAEGVRRLHGILVGNVVGWPMLS